MRHEFSNDQRVAISSGAPSNISSSIDISNVQGTLREVRVAIDLDHTYTADLEISLLPPDGQPILLVGRRGGSGDHFHDTVFSDDATASIINAAPPFSGTFRPEQPLSGLVNHNASGRWTLRVVDRFFFDGGALNRWDLTLVTQDVAPQSEFNIDVRFQGGLSTSQQAIFQTAAARWSEVIIGDLPDVVLNGQVVDDVIIDAQGSRIDGPGRILGQAAPRFIRTDSSLPISGFMEFDIDDLARMEADGSLLNVIIHEMGHVLGIGTLWSRMGLLQGAGTANPVFTGTNAMREFAVLTGSPVVRPVPVANTGGPGTRDGHWRESVFGNELMTGFLNIGINPLSRLSIAALEDMGYQVNYDAADPYTLPSALELAMLGIGAGEHAQHCQMCGHGRRAGGPVVLPAAALV